MYRFATLILFTFYVSTSFAGSDSPNVSASSAGMGFVRASFYDNYSIFTNQAGIAFQENKTISLSYRQAYMSEISQGSLGFVYPMKRLSLGISFYETGFVEAKNQAIGLATGIKITPFMSLGINVSWLRSLAEGYNTDHQIIPEIGVISKINDKIQYGIHLYNPSPVFLENPEEIAQARQPVMYATGFCYMVSDKINLIAEVSKAENLSAQVHIGMNYELEKITIRTGFMSGPATYSLGVGYELKGLHVDVALAYHENLGITPQSSFAYGW